MYAVQELEGRLLAAGHRVVLVAPASAGTSPDAGHPHRREVRLPSVRVPAVKLQLSLGKGFREVLDAFAADPPDVVHVHGLGPVGLLGMWVAERTGRPVVVTWHTDFDAYADYFGPLVWVLDLAYRGFLGRFEQGRRYLSADAAPTGRGRARDRLTRLARTMLATADLVTTPSPKTAARALQLAPTATVRPVPNGCDPLPVLSAVPRGPGPRLLYVGWISAEKGIPVLLDAFARVHARHPDAELMLVGSTNSGDLRLGRALRRGVAAGWLRLPGEVPRRELGAFYAGADAFVLPSTTETQALVLHEAAHAGLPLVLVDRGLDLVAEDGVNAVLAAPEPEALADALAGMLALLRDRDWRERAAGRGRELAARWSGAAQGAAMLAIYAELAASGRCQPNGPGDSVAAS